jgi:hypothetical protein
MLDFDYPLRRQNDSSGRKQTAGAFFLGTITIRGSAR